MTQPTAGSEGGQALHVLAEAKGRGGIVVTGPRMELRVLQTNAVSTAYVAWLNDPEVNRFLECRFVHQTTDSVRAFVASTLAAPNSLPLAITVGTSHIGNIKLGPIDPNHGSGEVGLLIGERSHWGQGFATEAIDTLAAWAFDTVGLAKLTAGAYASNEGSIRAFARAGFSTEGRRTAQFALGDQREDLILLGKVSS